MSPNRHPRTQKLLLAPRDTKIRFFFAKKASVYRTQQGDRSPIPKRSIAYPKKMDRPKNRSITSSSRIPVLRGSIKISYWINHNTTKIFTTQHDRSPKPPDRSPCYRSIACSRAIDPWHQKSEQQHFQKI